MKSSAAITASRRPRSAATWADLDAAAAPAPSVARGEHGARSAALNGRAWPTSAFDGGPSSSRRALEGPEDGDDERDPGGGDQRRRQASAIPDHPLDYAGFKFGRFGVLRCPRQSRCHHV